ncbi:MAG: sigma-54 dependent transcriptional regulator [Deltaproteobacteria bacterium]|nr:sigma-54 dependent transcriptional regulator [Deltaproteobacteria bacterium]
MTAAPPENESAPTSPPPYNVLLCIADPRMRQLLAFSFRRSQLHVVETSTAQEVLAQSKQMNSYAAVCVCDLPPQGMDGVAFLRAMQKASVYHPVVMITEDVSPAELIRLEKADVYRVIKRDVGLEDLRMTVRNAMVFSHLQIRVEQMEQEHQGIIPDMIGSSAAIVKVRKLVNKALNRDITVLLEGESGTGKELVARAIHTQSNRKEHKFVAINCAAINPTLLDSQLFGHERGAFTGAINRQVGRFQEADGGTLFLDEVGDLSMELQAKLLRVIQTRVVAPLGGKETKVDVRLVSATNVDLQAAVRAGRFRQDLYYRLAGYPIPLPPLRSRGDDVITLARFFLQQFAKKENKKIQGIKPDVEKALLKHNWPGNVRELENMIFRAVVICEDKKLSMEDFPALLGEDLRESAPFPAPPAWAPPAQAVPVAAAPSFGTPEPPAGPQSLANLEAHAIRHAVEQARGNLSLASRTLGISRATLYRKVERYGLKM